MRSEMSGGRAAAALHLCTLGGSYTRTADSLLFFPDDGSILLLSEREAEAVQQECTRLQEQGMQLQAQGMCDQSVQEQSMREQRVQDQHVLQTSSPAQLCSSAGPHHHQHDHHSNSTPSQSVPPPSHQRTPAGAACADPMPLPSPILLQLCYVWHALSRELRQTPRLSVPLTLGEFRSVPCPPVPVSSRGDSKDVGWLRGAVVCSRVGVGDSEEQRGEALHGAEGGMVEQVPAGGGQQ
eukprot:scaffold107173_cov24-Tisochrysis_lutea.AAC.1